MSPSGLSSQAISMSLRQAGKCLVACLLAAVLVLPEPVLASVDLSECERRLSQSDNKPLVLTTQDRQEILNVLYDGTQDAEAQFMKAFDIYLEARLRDVPEEKLPRIRSAAATLLRWTDPNSRRVSANGLKIEMPEQLKTTALPYIVLAHEMEHVIQVETGNPITYIFHTLFSSEHLFTVERAAMQAEWEFMSALPQEMTIEAARVLRRMGISEFYRSVFAAMLEGHGLDRNSYILKQHMNHRYSLENTRNVTGFQAELAVLIGMPVPPCILLLINYLLN